MFVTCTGTNQRVHVPHIIHADMCRSRVLVCRAELLLLLLLPPPPPLLLLLPPPPPLLLLLPPPQQQVYCLQYTYSKFCLSERFLLPPLINPQLHQQQQRQHACTQQEQHHNRQQGKSQYPLASPRSLQEFLVTLLTAIPNGGSCTCPKGQLPAYYHTMLINRKISRGLLPLAPTTPHPHFPSCFSAQTRFLSPRSSC